MPEGLNVEVAHKLTEKEDEAERRKHRWGKEVAEVIEVLVLAVSRDSDRVERLPGIAVDLPRGPLVWAGNDAAFRGQCRLHPWRSTTGRGLCNVQQLARGQSRGEH